LFFWLVHTIFASKTRITRLHSFRRHRFWGPGRKLPSAWSFYVVYQFPHRPTPPITGLLFRSTPLPVVGWSPDRHNAPYRSEVKTAFPFLLWPGLLTGPWGPTEGLQSGSGPKSDSRPANICGARPASLPNRYLPGGAPTGRSYTSEGREPWHRLHPDSAAATVPRFANF
jgi:hypothetical protein